MPIEGIEQQLRIEIGPKIHVYVGGTEVFDGDDLSIYGLPGEKIDVKVLFTIAGNTPPYGNHRAKVTIESDTDAIPIYHNQGEGSDIASLNADGNRVDFSWTPAASSNYSMLIEYRGDLEVFTWEPVKFRWTTSTFLPSITLASAYTRIPKGALIPIKTTVTSNGIGIDAGRNSLKINGNILLGIGSQKMSYVQDLGERGCEDIIKGCDCNPPGTGEICGDFCAQNPRNEIVDYILTSRGESVFVLNSGNYGAFVQTVPTQISIESIYDGNAMVKFDGFRCSNGEPYYCSNCSGVFYPCKVRCWSFGDVYTKSSRTINVLIDKNITQLSISSIPTQVETYQPINIEARLTHEDVTSPAFIQTLFVQSAPIPPPRIKFTIKKSGTVVLQEDIMSNTGVFNFALSPLSLKPGNYTISTSYAGNDIHYGTESQEAEFTVSTNQTIIDVTVIPASNFKTLTNGSINVDLKDELGGFSGSVKIFLENTLWNTISTDSNGKKSVQISGSQLKVGSNTITVEYIPDEYHTTATDAITFTVSKITTSITIGASSSQITRLDSVDITGIIGEDDASAGFASPLQTTVIINVAGNQIQKQTASDGSFKVTLRGLDLPIDNNVIGVTFVETATHLGDSSNTVTVDVVKITPNLSLFTEQEKITVFEQSVIAGHIEDSNNPLSNVPIKVQYLDTQEVLQTDAGGNFQVTLLGSESPLGLIGIQAIFDETEVYTTATNSITITVKPAVSVIEWLSPPQSVFTTIDAIFEGILKANNIALASAPVNVSINGANESTVTTDDSGKFSFVTNFETPATYTIEAVYTGTSDRRILGDSVSFDLIAAIQPPDEYATILDAIYDDKTDVLDITLKSEFDTCMKNVPIKIKIDGKPSGEVTTDETGKATKLLGLESGTHTIVVTFDGIITPRLVCKISTKSFDVMVALYRALGRLVPISSQHIIYGVGAIVGLVVLGAVLKRLKKDDDF